MTYTVQFEPRDPTPDRQGFHWRVLTGDALEVLRTLPDGSARCCVTSPPYYGLRDYGTGRWVGGDPDCDHQPPTGHQRRGASSCRAGRASDESDRTDAIRLVCPSCGAVRDDGQIGIESTPQEYVARLVEVFREVRRVLADDGTLWLNLGDSYARDRSKGTHRPEHRGKLRYLYEAGAGQAAGQTDLSAAGVKPKDLLMIPARVALALQSDGWYLRADIIWHKPNACPESVTDRPTRCHEHLFLLARAERYHFDRLAILEPFADQRQGRDGAKRPRERNRGGRTDGFTKPNGIDPSANGGRRRRDVWSIPTQPFQEAHFAVFPPALVEPCVLAGSEPGDVVLDPFCGSGTTGIVAVGLGRRFAGIDLSPEYAAMAERRIAEAGNQRQLGLFDEEV